MKKQKKLLILEYLISSMILFGCAGAPELLTLQSDDIKNIKQLAIVTNLLDEEIRIIDHTGIKEGQSQAHYYGGGLLGALADITVKEIRASNRIKSVLGGDPDTLRQAVRNFPIKQVFDENIDKIFSKNCEFTRPGDIDDLGINEFPNTKSENGKTIRDYTTLSKKLNVNTVLEIDFIYGLAVCRYEFEPTAIILADVSIINIEKNTLCMKKTISSDYYYKKGYTLNEFKANDAELFKKEISEVMRYVAQLVASDFGVASPPDVTSLKHKSYWNPEK